MENGMAASIIVPPGVLRPCGICGVTTGFYVCFRCYCRAKTNPASFVATWDKPVFTQVQPDGL